jgi:hypothetical protein
MLRLLCCVLMVGCASPQVRPTKTAQSVATGEHYKNSGGFLSEGKPELDIGPSNGEVLLFLGAVGLVAWAIVAADDGESAEPGQSPQVAANDTDAAIPAWARPLD